MKTSFLVALLVALIYFYHGPAKSTSTAKDTGAQPAASPVGVRQIVVAPAPSYADRWKTGANAFADLKTGPNAQVEFAPFMPDEQTNWNQTPGYTIVSGVNLRR